MNMYIFAKDWFFFLLKDGLIFCQESFGIQIYKYHLYIIYHTYVEHNNVYEYNCVFVENITLN